MFVCVSFRMIPSEGDKLSLIVPTAPCRGLMIKSTYLHSYPWQVAIIVWSHIAVANNCSKSSFSDRCLMLPLLHHSHASPLSTNNVDRKKDKRRMRNRACVIISLASTILSERIISGIRSMLFQTVGSFTATVVYSRDIFNGARQERRRLTAVQLGRFCLTATCMLFMSTSNLERSQPWPSSEFGALGAALESMGDNLCPNVTHAIHPKVQRGDLF